jgi:V/A-type H+-transporting ATPase subunit B
VGFGEAVEIEHGAARLHGRVLEIGRDVAVVEVFEGTSGLTLGGTRVRFLARPLEVDVDIDMLGRSFDGRGEPIDGGAAPAADRHCVDGVPINCRPGLPPRLIQTGVSAIGSEPWCGAEAHLLGGTSPARCSQVVLSPPARRAGFAVVFAAIGVRHDVADSFRRPGGVEPRARCS